MNDPLTESNDYRQLILTHELRLTPNDVKELVFRDEVSALWLGEPARLPFRNKSNAWLVDQGQNRRYGRVVEAIQRSGSFTWTVSWSPQRWPGATLNIQIRPGTRPHTSSIQIREEGLQAPEAKADLSYFWQDALDRLDRIVASVRNRRDSPRQALVVIHGIGEQLPGKTMMELVSALFPEAGHNLSRRWVRPDTISPTFELRKVTIEATPRTRGAESELPSNANCPATDVFEMYWAHLMGDTTLAQVLDWVAYLLLRPRRKIPRVLLAHFIVSWICLAAIAGLAILYAFGVFSTELVLGAAALAVLGLVVRGASRMVTKTTIGFIGDAARYLRAKPGNIARRQEIRDAGVTLLQQLQQSGKYDRIIVLGHSLGSVIAYDILSHAWIRSHLDHLSATTCKSSALSAVEMAVHKEKDASVAQELQFQAWKEHRANTQPWLVTDLVTVGSPLTYADFLIADNRQEFLQLKTQRTMPTCPPTPELKGGRPLIHRTQTYHLSDGRDRTIHSPDFGSLFALTRWTNLYFPFTGVVRGDPVGGPVAPLFGSWISDVRVEPPRGGVMGFAHTSYWKSSSTITPDDAHVTQLRNALKLNVTNELLDVAHSRPAYTYIRK